MSADQVDAAIADDARPLEVVRFLGLRPGPKLIIVGAVHGNEPCGPLSIARAIEDCRAGRLLIRRGEVTFVPVANGKAFRLKAREGDRNLNRDLYEKLLPQDYEDRLGNRLCALLRQHDVLLDIHSFRSEGEPFVFLGPRDNRGDVEAFRHAVAEWDFATTLGVSTVIHGWLDAYAHHIARRAELGLPHRGMAEGFGTTEFMRFAGGYGVTLECGQHDDPQSVEVGYAAIRNALAHLGLIDAPPPAPSAHTAIQIVHAAICENIGDRVEGVWRTGDAVVADQIIARRADGTAIKAPEAGFIVFPNLKPNVGELLFYFGVASERLNDRGVTHDAETARANAVRAVAGANL